jgi:hypothetical protein
MPRCQDVTAVRVGVWGLTGGVSRCGYLLLGSLVGVCFMVSQVKNRRLQLQQLYGFDFPEDLFRFWEFVNRLAPLAPLTAVAAATGIHLAGPFDVLAGRFDGRTPAYPQHLHWRYANDPPEFFTVLAGDVDRLHYGYYLDDPGKDPYCVASYYANDAFELEGNCATLFEALRLELEQRERDAAEHLESHPSKAAEYAAKRVELVELRAKLLRYATADRPETGEAYVEKYLWARPPRSAQVVAATREGMGIVVPPDQYRPLSVPDKKLWKYLRKTEDLRELLDEARTALAEGFPGTALKLGKELWCTGNKREFAYDLLDAAYATLGREVLREVLAHHRAHPHLPYVDILHA